MKAPCNVVRWRGTERWRADRRRRRRWRGACAAAVIDDHDGRADMLEVAHDISEGFGDVCDVEGLAGRAGIVCCAHWFLISRDYSLNMT